MGAVNSGERAGRALGDGLKRAEKTVGQLAVSGRLHRLPRTLSDDYVLASARGVDGVLGSGSNGKVLLANSIVSPDTMVAVKHLELDARTKKEDIEFAVSEAEIFLTMDHPHVARLVDVYVGDGQVSLVAECLAGGELGQRAKQRKNARFGEQEAASAVYQMLKAVNYIHSRGVVHRDIKATNFLYQSVDTDVLKLIDFGFSRTFRPKERMSKSLGTLLYVAPEVLSGNYDSKCDMWSIGVTAFEILLGYSPFSASAEWRIEENIMRGKFRKNRIRWDRLSDNAKDFINSLLVVDPMKRLSARQALKHPWLQARHAADSPSRASEQVAKEITRSLANWGQASAAWKAVASMAAWSLPDDERASLQRQFEMIDQDASGAISIGEFKSAVQESHKTDDVVTQWAFDSLAETGQGEIRWSQFLAAMVGSNLQLNPDLLQSTFRRFDKDGSGCITVDGLRAVLGDSYHGCDVQAVLQFFDSDCDGKITFEEFVSFMMDHHGELDVSPMKSALVLSERGFTPEPAKKEPDSEDETASWVSGGSRSFASQEEASAPWWACCSSRSGSE